MIVDHGHGLSSAFLHSVAHSWWRRAIGWCRGRSSRRSGRPVAPPDRIWTGGSNLRPAPRSVPAGGADARSRSTGPNTNLGPARDASPAPPAPASVGVPPAVVQAGERRSCRVPKADRPLALGAPRADRFRCGDDRPSREDLSRESRRNSRKLGSVLHTVTASPRRGTPRTRRAKSSIGHSRRRPRRRSSSHDTQWRGGASRAARRACRGRCPAAGRSRRSGARCGAFPCLRCTRAARRPRRTGVDANRQYVCAGRRSRLRRCGTNRRTPPRILPGRVRPSRSRRRHRPAPPPDRGATGRRSRRPPADSMNTQSAGRDGMSGHLAGSVELLRAASTAFATRTGPAGPARRRRTVGRMHGRPAPSTPPRLLETQRPVHAEARGNGPRRRSRPRSSQSLDEKTGISLSQ